MSMQDPVADLLTRVRNAQSMGIREVVLPYSFIKNEILRVLLDEGFINQYNVIADGAKKDLKIDLKYYQGRPVIERIKRVSRPALRVYRSCRELPQIRGGLGIAIISTPKGVMTDKAARAQNVGGEVLCTVE